MIIWEFHYYIGQLPLAIIHVDDWEKETLADDKIIYVKNNKGLCVSGSDYYAYDGKKFYVWTDPNQLWVDKKKPIGWVEGEPLWKPPILNCKVRAGIFMPDDEAREIGLL